MSNIIINDDSILFCLKLETRQEYPDLQFLFNIKLEVLTRELRQKIKGAQFEKEAIKLS